MRLQASGERRMSSLRARLGPWLWILATCATASSAYVIFWYYSHLFSHVTADDEMRGVLTLTTQIPPSSRLWTMTAKNNNPKDIAAFAFSLIGYKHDGTPRQLGVIRHDLIWSFPYVKVNDDPTRRNEYGPLRHAESRSFVVPVQPANAIEYVELTGSPVMILFADRTWLGDKRRAHQIFSQHAGAAAAYSTLIGLCSKLSLHTSGKELAQLAYKLLNNTHSFTETLEVNVTADRSEFMIGAENVCKSEGIIISQMSTRFGTVAEAQRWLSAKDREFQLQYDINRFYSTNR
jgi:hypothetical protein